jgi:hypothetical protein
LSHGESHHAPHNEHEPKTENHGAISL